jgi:serine/threonine-protein kinase
LSQKVRHASEPPKPLREFSPAIPEGLQQIINWMLAKKPEERYPTPERAAQALQMFLVAGSEPPRPAEEPQMRKYLTWLETSDDDKSDDAGAAALPAAHGLPMASPVAAVAPAPMAPPASPPRVEKPAAKVAALPSARKEKRRSKPIRATQPMAALKSTSNPSASASATIDVELVTVPPTSTAQGWKRWLPQNTREWLMLGIGAGSVAVAGLLGMIIAMMLRD